MTKGIKYTLIALVVAAAAGAIAYFAFGGSADAYLSVIPKDAQGIAKLDVRALIKKSKMTDEQQQEVLKRMSDQIGEETDMSDPGIDLSRPLYGFVSQSGYFAVVGKVSDEDALVKACSPANGKDQPIDVQKQRGYSWMVLRDNYLVAFNADKALFMGPAVGAAQDQLRNEMYRYLEQDKSESAIGTEFYDYVKGSDAPGAAVLTMSLVPEAARKAVSQYIPASVTDDVALALTADLGEHEMSLASELITHNDEAKAKIKEFEQLFRTIDADLVDASYEGAIAWFCMNVEGKETLKLLRANPTLRLILMGLNMVIDFDQMINAIDGDVAIEAALPKDTRTMKDWGVRLTAQLDNKDFLKNADYWVKSNRLNSVRALSATDFSMDFSGQHLLFGVDDDVLYFTSRDDMRQAKGNDYITSHKRDIKGNRIFFTLDLAKAANADKSVAELASLFERISLGMKVLGEFKFEAEGTPDKNLLYEILKK